MYLPQITTLSVSFFRNYDLLPKFKGPTQRTHDVKMTSYQRHFGTICPLGIGLLVLKIHVIFYREVSLRGSQYSSAVVNDCDKQTLNNYIIFEVPIKDDRLIND